MQSTDQRSTGLLILSHTICFSTVLPGHTGPLYYFSSPCFSEMKRFTSHTYQQDFSSPGRKVRGSRPSESTTRATDTAAGEIVGRPHEQSVLGIDKVLQGKGCFSRTS